MSFPEECNSYYFHWDREKNKALPKIQQGHSLLYYLAQCVEQICMNFYSNMLSHLQLGSIDSKCSSKFAIMIFMTIRKKNAGCFIGDCSSQAAECVSANKMKGIFAPSFPMSYCHWWEIAWFKVWIYCNKVPAAAGLECNSSDTAIYPVTEHKSNVPNVVFSLGILNESIR